MTTTDIHRTIEAVWRIESAKLIAALARMVHDVGLAEELAQDALVAALERWPETGVPDNPAAWLMTTAKRRAIDRLRRSKLQWSKHAEIARELEEQQDMAASGLDDRLDDDIGDDLLRLVFTACHPVLPREGRIALTLRLLGGLSTDEIARAFLVPEPTMAQRIVRAKRTLSDKQVPFEVPRGDDRLERLASALGVDLVRLCSPAVHPVLPREGRIALTLRLLGGLSTDEIARAFLVPEPTMAQRIVRAKRTLSDKQVPFEVPRGDDRLERLASVLEVIYLVFNEGYAATAGDDWLRPALCDEALRLGRILAGLAPREPEVHGLLALRSEERRVGKGGGSTGQSWWCPDNKK